MDEFDAVIEEQITKIEHAYHILQDIMPEYFFRTFADRIGKILPFLCHLDQQSGIRRAEFNGEVFFVYLLSETNNPAVTSRMMDGQHLLEASVHQSEKTFLVGGEPATLIIEHYSLAQEAPSEACFSLEEIQREYARQFGDSQREAIAELYGRLNFNVLHDLDLAKLAQRIDWVLKGQQNDYILAEIGAWDHECLRLRVAWPMPSDNKDFCSQLFEVILSHGLELRRCYFREMSSNDDIEAFERLPVIVVTAYLNPKPGETLSQERLDSLLNDIRMLGWVETNDLLHQELLRRGGFSLPAVNWLRAMSEFIHGQLAYVNCHVYTLDDMYRHMIIYSEYCQMLFEEFERRFDPARPRRSEKEKQEFSAEFSAQVAQINTGNQSKNQVIKTIFNCALNFLDCILKSNFYVCDKTALSFRLSVGFCVFYRELSADYAAAFPEALPYAVFYFYRRGAFGYHVRFTDIARGGWRSVVPSRGGNRLEMNDNYEYARDEAFRECYVLAHTQHLKNKDIYEGGAKLLTLLVPVRESGKLRPVLWHIQRSITRALLSLINYDQNKVLRDPQIVDYLGEREILEIGPDENMFDPMIEWIGAYAQKQQYRLGSGLISGKPGAGINHKEYGVTSFGIHQYLIKTLQELGIDPRREQFSVKIAGGPGGDVAGNAMKLLLAKENGDFIYPRLSIIAVTDGPAIAYDPEGLDRDELARLIHVSALDEFDPAKLRGEGAMLALSAPIERNGKQYYQQHLLQKGKLQNNLLGRDSFMHLFQDNLTCYADVFIPGGGRPSTINEDNWEKFFPGGQASFRAIIEGANSYITPGARKSIQERGVWIIKDASANKCGVITSSMEILSGIMLDEDEFKTHKEELVSQVMDILQQLSRQEADWLFARFHASGIMMTELTEKLSSEINHAKTQIYEYLASQPAFITRELLLSHLPAIFRQSYPERYQRLPMEYRRALAAVELACRLVYSENAMDLGARLLTIMSAEEKMAMP